MNNAAGQLLGYALQFPRALYHLVKCGPGDCICVEVLGDVSTVKANGDIISEEDKSSINGNPLTDRSVDLWKTFYNWIQSINKDEIVIEKTLFILYCNKSGRKSIVDAFSTVKNIEEATKSINDAKMKLDDINGDHEIWKYYDYVVNKNDETLKKILVNFELQVGSDFGIEELEHELQKLLINENYIGYAIDKLNGWLLKKINLKISEKNNAIVSWEEYKDEFSILFERIRSKELIDFTYNTSFDDDINDAIRVQPLYIRQLELIESPEDDLIEAVTDYMKADSNIEKWIENDIINIELAEDFEEKLKRFWGSQVKKTEILYRQCSDTEKGQLIYEECKSKEITIRDMSPPASTIPGMYHMLADEPELGWHPEWFDRLQKREK